MVIIGCDFHPRFFSRSRLWMRRRGSMASGVLSHPEEAERFYHEGHCKQVRVGLKLRGTSAGFDGRWRSWGKEFRCGDGGRDPGSVRAPAEDRQARRPALILDLLVKGTFPRQCNLHRPRTELRQLLLHRCRMVRMATRIKNQLDALAKNEGMLAARGRKGRKAVLSCRWRAGMRCAGRTGWMCWSCWERRVLALDEAVRVAAEQNASAALLMTYPGVAWWFRWLRADLRGLAPVPPGQAGGQLPGADSGGGVERPEAAPGARFQAGQQHAVAAGRPRSTPSGRMPAGIGSMCGCR